MFRYYLVEYFSYSDKQYERHTIRIGVQKNLRLFYTLLRSQVATAPRSENKVCQRISVLCFSNPQILHIAATNYHIVHTIETKHNLQSTLLCCILV